jgi:carboxypeptidase T
MRPRVRFGTAIAAVVLAAASAGAIGMRPSAADARRGGEQVLILRIGVQNQRDVDRVLGLDLDLVEARGTNYLLAVGDAATLRRLRARGFDVSIQSTLPSLPAFGGAQPNTFDNGYQTVADHYAHLNAVAAAHPGLAKVIDFGDSWKKTKGSGGADLLAICITKMRAGSCALAPSPKKIRFVLMGAIHARELTTSELASRWVDYLVQGASTDPEVSWLLRTAEMWVIPVMNPDGRQIVEGGGTQPYMQRKNADNSAPGSNVCANPPTVGNQAGVDLNRNAATPNWGGVGTSPDVCSQTYPGTAPASEPEQQALQTLQAQLFPDTKGALRNAPAALTTRGVFLSLHSYANLVMFPYGDSLSAGYAPNDAGLRSVGFRMSFFNAYQTGTPDEVLYPVSGSSDDWSYGTLGVASFTFEVGPASGTCGGFAPPYSCVASTFWPKNLPAFLYAAKVAAGPYKLGLGPTVLSPNVSSASVPAGTPVTLTARARDDAYGSVAPPNPPAAQAVVRARYAIDAKPSGTNSYDMNAADGQFDLANEMITATVDTTGLALGRHTLVIQARDADGHWGPATAIFLTVTA